MSRITLITGGARSGKSSHALALARQYPLPRAFIATAEPCDDDMRRRIEHHRAERAKEFDTHESPLNLAAAIRELSHEVRVAVVDCLTVWLGNLLHHFADAAQSQEQIDRFLVSLDRPTCDLIIVTNEVGMGIVPHNDLARQYRDLAGTLNQQVAAKADRVVFMVSGCPLLVKGV